MREHELVVKRWVRQEGRWGRVHARRALQVEPGVAGRGDSGVGGGGDGGGVAVGVTVGAIVDVLWGRVSGVEVVVEKVVIVVVVVVNVKELRVFACLLLADFQRLDVVVGQARTEAHLDVALDPDLVVEELLAADAAPTRHACSLVRFHAGRVAEVSGLQVCLEGVPSGEAASLVAAGFGRVVVEGAVVSLGLGVLLHVAGEVPADAELRVAVWTLVDLLRVGDVVLKVVAVVLIGETVLDAAIIGVGGDGVQTVLGVVRLDRGDWGQRDKLVLDFHAGVGVALNVGAGARARVGRN